MTGAVFFDFDGTLAHTAPDMAAAFREWQTAAGQTPAEYEVIRPAVSGGARALLKLAGVEEDSPDYESARLDFLARYEAGGYQRTFLFGGMKECLTSLKEDGWKWGIITNKPRQYFAPIADNLSLNTDPEMLLPDSPPAAAAMVAGDDCPRGKPSPESLLLAAEIAGVPPRRCIYIGDDARDSQAAQAAGMRFIVAGWGYWPTTEWFRSPAADAIISSPHCIPPLARMYAAIFSDEN